MCNDTRTLCWKQLPVHWTTGLVLKIALKIREMCWEGERGGNSAVSRVRHSTWEGVINTTHTKGQQPLTVWFSKNNLYIVVDQSLKISQTQARERIAGDTSRKMLPENTSHGNSFGWSVLSSFHPALHWTFEQSAESRNKKNPRLRRQKKS